MRKGMWWLLAGALLCTGAQAAEWKRGIENQRVADLGDGTYLNPVLAGDHPDPSVLRTARTTTSRCPPSTPIPACRCGIRATW